MNLAWLLLCFSQTFERLSISTRLDTVSSIIREVRSVLIVVTVVTLWWTALGFILHFYFDNCVHHHVIEISEVCPVYNVDWRFYDKQLVYIDRWIHY